VSARPFSVRQATVVFAGPFGTGKTEVAISYARTAARAGKRVCVLDLDVVTAYFRVGDYREQLRGEGIEVIAAPGALASFELPALPPEIAEALAADHLHVVADAGGDPVGARVLAVYAQQIAARGYDMWMVVNVFRPSSAAPEAILRQASEIEGRSGLRFTGLLANPHLGSLTQPRDISQGLQVARKAAQEMGLPVALAVERGLLADRPAADLPVLALDLTLRPPWENQVRQD